GESWRITAPTPCSAAISAAVCAASRAAGWPHPRRAETQAVAPRRRATLARTAGWIFPSRASRTYIGRRTNPCESWPARFAPWSPPATMAARSSGVPTPRSSAMQIPYSSSERSVTSAMRSVQQFRIDPIAQFCAAEIAVQVLDEQRDDPLVLPQRQPGGVGAQQDIWQLPQRAVGGERL